MTTDATELEQITTTDVVQKAIIDTLDGETLAGHRIFAPRTWPTWDGEYPVLIVLTPRERKDRQGLGDLLFNVRSTVRVIGRVSVAAAEDEEGAIVALADLVLMQRQIETHVVGDPRVARLAQVTAIDVQQGTRSIGKKHIGELIMDLEMSFSQGPEAFFIPQSVPLESVRAFIDSGNVVDKEGTYPTPPLPYNVPDAPRTEGPDGRQEGGFEVDGLQS